VVIVGAGNRGLIYGRFSTIDTSAMMVSAIVDPDPARLAAASAEFDIPATQCFTDVGDLPRAGKIADAAICATMDAEHARVTQALMRQGYPVLLEKPAAQSATELMELQRSAASADRILMICHVLRYAPFYSQIAEHVRSGSIGELVSVEMAEHVRFEHMVTAFVRGPWGSAERSGSGILLAKCCHDLDLMTWLAAPQRPVRVTSTGGLHYFHPSHAPTGAGTRCTVDCPIEPTCAYSAKRLYLDEDRWPHRSWETMPASLQGSQEARAASLDDANPYGRCVWHSDNTVVDRQTVTVEFDQGAVGSFTLAGTGSGPTRRISLVGTDGTIEGELNSGVFRLHRIDKDDPSLLTTTAFDTGVVDQVHGGGDMPLIADFIAAVRGEPVSPRRTELEDSINGHLMVFAAEKARDEGCWVSLDELRSTPHTGLGPS